MIPAHENAPPSLAKKYKRAGSYHKLAQRIGVNVKYVHALLRFGEEPPDTTPRLRDIRHRLGLRKKIRRAADRPPRPPAPPWLQWWNNIGKERRHRLIAIIYRIHQKEQNK